MPKRLKILKRKILAAPWRGVKFNRSFAQDVFINIVGFMPLGFLLNAIFLRFKRIIRNHDVFFTVFICFVLSLLIEITQAWIPSRSSDMLDLILNTAGASLGVIFYRFSLRWKREAI